MKVFALSAIMAAHVSAEFNLDKTLSAMLGAQSDDVQRAFSGQMGNTINGLNEYGCWCYFYEDHGRGKGQPVDAIDEMCKILSDGYECAMRDAEDEGTTCVPWEVTYTSALGGSGLSVAEECAQVNSGNNCAIRACTVEGSFVGNLLDAFIGGGAQINNDNRHSNGFDVATGCPVKKNGGGPSNKACCGNYPDRFPFKTIGGDRQCCGSRTYNALTLKCCDSDSSTVKFNC
jgi:hypothetical protein